MAHVYANERERAKKKAPEMNSVVEEEIEELLGWIEEENEVQNLQDEDNVRNSQSQDYFATLESMEE